MNTTHNADSQAVAGQVERTVRPYATSVTWRNDQGGSWQQWHDDEDPMPDEWDEAGPPDEVVHVYSAAQMEAMLAAERERCARICDVTPPYPFRPSIEAAHAIRNQEANDGRG